MFNKQKGKNALALDDYGTRLWRANGLNKPDSIYASSLVANIATVLFVLIDFICLYTVWNTVQTESSMMIALIAVGCAVCLDVPLAIAGNELKSHHQKIKSKSSTMIVMVLAITTFLLTFIFAFWFRLETKELTFDISSGSTLTNTLAETTTVEANDSNAVIVAALFNAVVPLCTSIASFVISYFAANPLGERISRYDTAIITLDSNITELEQALQEAETIDEHDRLLRENEAISKEVYIAACKARGLSLKQYALVEIMKILKNPDDISRLVEIGKQLNESAGVGL